jgi:hypothetical protein
MNVLKHDSEILNLAYLLVCNVWKVDMLPTSASDFFYRDGLRIDISLI